jgi:hypothetical protein
MRSRVELMCGICGVIGFENSHGAGPLASLRGLGWKANAIPSATSSRGELFLTSTFVERGNRKHSNLLQAPPIAFD